MNKTQAAQNSRDETLAALGKAIGQLDSLNLTASEYAVAATAIMDAIKIIRDTQS